MFSKEVLTNFNQLSLAERTRGESSQNDYPSIDREKSKIASKIVLPLLGFQIWFF